jgi:hypothetical protein
MRSMNDRDDFFANASRDTIQSLYFFLYIAQTQSDTH